MRSLTGRPHLPLATDGLVARAAIAYLAALVVLALPLAFRGPASAAPAELVGTEISDGRGGWRPADPARLTLPKGQVSVLRARVRLDPAVTRSGEPLGLYLSGTFSAQATWNGVPVGRKGRPGVTAAAEIAGPIDTVLPLPERLVRAGDNQLVLRLSAEHLRHPVTSVIHGQGGVFGLRVAPFSAEARRPIGYYAAPFLMSVVLMLGWLTLVLRRAGRADRYGAVILAALAVSALAEVSRSLIDYPYAWHDLRMATVALAAVAASGAILLHAQRLAGMSARPGLRLAAVGAILGGVVLMPGPGDSAVLAAGALAGAATAAWGAVRRRPGALELSAALGVMAAFAIIDRGAFMDRSLYAAAAPLVAHLVWRLRPAATEAPATAPVTGRLAVGPADARRFIAFTAIRAIHGAGDYAELRLASGERVLHGETLQALEARLPADFFRAHRSHLVNLEAVTALQAQGGGRYRLSLADGTWLPVSRAKVAELRLRLPHPVSGRVASAARRVGKYGSER